MRCHELKTWPEFFRPVVSGEKTFELRQDDRPGGFHAGDLLLLLEYDPLHGYTGHTVTKYVTYVLSGMGLQRGYVCMALAEPPPDMQDEKE